LTVVRISAILGVQVWRFLAAGDHPFTTWRGNGWRYFQVYRDDISTFVTCARQLLDLRLLP
jgi:hypothetical protein